MNIREEFNPFDNCWPGTDIPVTLYSPEEWDAATDELEMLADEDYL